MYGFVHDSLKWAIFNQVQNYYFRKNVENAMVLNHEIVENVEKCRKMSKNVEKCQKMSKNVEKMSKMRGSLTMKKFR
jgi:hypothetical protein